MSTEEKDNLGKPPFFKKWSSLYYWVIGFLFTLILLFWAFTEYFN